jgi:hypothetical protein
MPMLNGNIRKMAAQLDSPISYSLVLKKDGKEQLLGLNQFLGKKISLKFEGEINCLHCEAKTAKSYSGGFCYKHTMSLAQCDMCILKPETCHFAEGTCREPEWGEKNCMIPHYVYLSNSSGAKVGITRHTQIPTRWIDQGAIQALPIFKVSTRLQSGMFEVLLGQEVSDKTNWRTMLKGEIPVVDLPSVRDELFEICGDGLDELEEEYGEDAVEFLEDEAVVDLNYPVLEYPTKVTSLNFDKLALIEGTLLGIKGQYLILDTGVINIRRHSGYQMTFNCGE